MTYRMYGTTLKTKTTFPDLTFDKGTKVRKKSIR